MLRKIIADHKKVGSQIYWLALLDLRKTYSGAVLGWAWAVIKPTIMIIVYWFVLSQGLRVGSSVQGVEFLPWLVVGMLPWLFIKDILSAGIGSFKKYKYLVSKVKFPVSTIPTFINLSNLFVHFILMFIVVIIILIQGAEIQMQVVQLPILIVLMFFTMLFWTYIVGPISAISKDFANFCKTIIQTLFWISGILFSVQSLDDGFMKSVLLLNPLNYIVEGYRKSFLYGEWFYEDTRSLVKFLIIFVLMGLIALYVYKRAYRDMVDSL